MSIAFSQALSRAIGDLAEPVITHYKMGILVYSLYGSLTYGNEKITPPGRTLNYRFFSNLVDELLDIGILKKYQNFPSRAFRIFGRKDGNPAEVACIVDPFSCLSHLSAMEYHGLTDRMPVKLFISSPPMQQWRLLAAARMSKDLGDSLQEYMAAGLPELSWKKISRIGKSEVHTFHSKRQGACKVVRGSPVRVSTIGRTFLEMLREPGLCGGLRHVVEVYKAHATVWLQPITDEIERHGAPIDKVRAGYILEEIVQVTSPLIESWAQFAQRGGSRKLDASAEYRPIWSPKWHLSLNLD